MLLSRPVARNFQVGVLSLTVLACGESVTQTGGLSLRPEGPKREAQKAESWGGVLGEGAASPFPTS